MSKFVPRYDEEREVYRDCPWCQGRGCNQCKAEADKEYKRQFPDGPKPIATFKRPEEIREAKEFIQELIKNVSNLSQV